MLALILLLVPKSKGKNERNMKKNVILLGLMIVSTIVFSQGKVDPAERSARQSDRMKKELSLDDVQTKAIAAINEEYTVKRAEIFRDSKLSQEAKREKLGALHKERQSAIEKVLTPEQTQKMADLRKQRMERHASRKHVRHEDRATRMQKDLSLTDDQTAKIKAIDKQFGEKFRTLRSDSTLAKEDFRNKAHELRKEHRKETKSVLTQEQYEKWQEKKRKKKM